MTLAELLENKFRGDIRFRGAAYVQAERVSLTRITADNIFGVVRDGVEYQTQISRTADQLKLYCNCAGGNQPEAKCKHLWATILAADEGGLLSGAARPGYIPPFAVESNGLSAELDDDWDDHGADDFVPSRGPRQALQAAPRLRPWEARLQKLRSEMRSHEPAAPAAGREREILYEIDVAESQGTGQLVVQTSQRQRRTSGQWGKLKPLKLRPDRLDEIEHSDDRRILAYLCGGTPERTNWYIQQAETQSAVHRFRVPYELSELILPLMCATGRVRLQSGDGSESAPLVWDDGPPWELSLELALDEQEEEWRLEGRLCREESTLPLADACLVVPGGLVATRTHIARLHDFDAFEWADLLLREGAVCVPAGDEHELVEQLFDMPSLPRLELPEALRLEEVRAEPVPHLVVTSPRGRGWQMERIQGNVQFDYLGTLVPGASARWAVVQREHGRCLLRDRVLEDRAWSQLQELGFRRLIDQRRGRGRDVEIAVRALGPAVRKLVELGWHVDADGRQVRQPGDFSFRVASGIDWFELHGQVDFDGRSVSFPELLSALARGDSTVRLDDGSLGILPEEWAKKFGLLAGLGFAQDDHIRFSPNQAALLDALLASQESVEYDEQFQELRDRLHSFGGVAPAQEPAGFSGELRVYQREGLGWLRFLQDFRLGGCLADDMGLGKTVQFLALLQDRRRGAGKLPPSLVIVPKSLLFNWRQECDRFTPEMKVLEYAGLDRAALRESIKEHDLVLTTYGMLRRDVLELKDVPFDYVVLDEAQTIKNSGSQVAKAARLLRAQHRLALSGTPIENHLGDLWSIFEFLNPGMLGRSSIFKAFASEAKDEESRRLLSSALRPFILRRTKRQVAGELPEKFEQTIYCDMRKEQRHLYAQLRDHYRASILGLIQEQGLAKSKMHVLEALLRLRQAACHPALLNKSDAEDPSAKLDVLVPHVEELLAEGHKVLVFSQFTSMLAIVQAHFDRREIVYEYLDGRTRNRGERVRRFQTDPDCGVFLISLKAGGLGLNLTAADYVFLLDPWWNPAVEAQAIDRAHRVGQTRQVFAYRLICRNTIEEKIAELQDRKRSLADAILQADANLLRELSTEDLELLLS